MKLSDVRGERTLDVIADIAAPVARIAMDDAASELFERRKRPEGMTPRQFALSRVEASLPALLKGHREDIITVLAAIKGEPRGEYAAGLNLANLMVDVTELLTDEAFADFLASPEQTRE